MVGLWLTLPGLIPAQRLQQKLSRGVVAIQNGNQILVSWRKLVQEPERASYNVYCRQNENDSYRKLNASPLTVTNFSTTATDVPAGSQIAVSLVYNGHESELSQPYTRTSHDVRSIFMEINYDGFLPTTDYQTRFVWPADLDGDGEYDYVVDRLSLTGGSDKIEGYSRHGQRLWTIDLGPNVNICDGHNDMVTAYDIDGDGKAEVILKTSDGTRFWDNTTNDWGKYLFLSDQPDTDHDGIINYYNQSKRNPPQYITVVDGLTGMEKNTIEMTYPGLYNRDNKADYYQDGDYFCLQGHIGIFYPDGLHPAVIFEYMSRHKTYGHQYYVSAWGYEFTQGRAGQFKELFTSPAGGASFHQIRIADVDGDGRDEMLEGGYGMRGDGSVCFNAGIAHGDRFHTGDINPERPGLETFAIQQDAPDMLGQILYDAADGTPLKRWYMGGVGDVGRGMAMDVDPSHKGYELWSAMDGNVYDATGEIIPGLSSTWPTEGVWWDGEPDREKLDSPDGGGYNPDIRKFNGFRLIEMGKLSGYTIHSENGKRAMFFGDIIGDWREELVFRRERPNQGCTGIVGFSSDYPTDKSLYCLQQNPAYRMQCTTRSYYQSPFTDYYLGYDMPLPPLPPVINSDLVWQGGTEWKNGSDGFLNTDRTSTSNWKDGQSVLFDMNGQNNVNIPATVCPDSAFIMIPAGQSLTWNGEGQTGGQMELWKSMGGRFIVNIPLNHHGNTYISEGILELNNELSDTLHLRARGTLAGNGTVNGPVIFEDALNYEGCRIQPGKEDQPVGKLTFGQSLCINARLFMEMSLQTDNQTTSDQISINGDLTIEHPFTIRFTINGGTPKPGTYTLLKWTGQTKGLPENGLIDPEIITTEGLEGYAYNLNREANSITLVIHEQREASDKVVWTGLENGNWDYTTSNFTLDNQPTAFVKGDCITFTDDATTKSIILNEQYPVGGLTFRHTTDYTIKGEGGFSGESGLVKSGSGCLTIEGNKHQFTGAVILEGGKVRINQLSEGGQPGSLGAAPATEGYWKMKNVILDIMSANTSTDKPLTIEDSVTINTASGLTALKGKISGNGILIKDGNGQLNLNFTGQNNYKNTILRNGTLAMGAWNTSFGPPGSQLTAYAGTLRIFDNNSSATAPVFNHILNIPENANVVLQAGSRCRLTGKLTGSGTLTYTTPYVRADWQMDMSAFKGTFHAGGSQMRLNQATDMSNTALILDDNVYLTHTKSGSGTEVNLTTKIGSLASTSSNCTVGSGTYEIGYDNTSVKYAGLFNNSATVKKYGNGTWTLTNSQPVGFSIYGGTLLLDDNASADNLTTVYEGGCLSGTGTAAQAIIRRGGTLSAGNTVKRKATLNITGNLTVHEGGKIHVRKFGPSCDNFNVEGQIRLYTPVIEIANERGEYENGSSYTIFTNFESLDIDGEIQIEPACPAEGLEWDLSTFANDGKIHIRNATDIKETEDRRISVSTNSATNTCQITFSERPTEKTALSLMDVNGRILLYQDITGQENCTLHLAPYAEGLYLLRIHSDGQKDYLHKIIRK